MQGQREAACQQRAEDRARLGWWRFFPGEDRQLRVLREWLKGLLPGCMARDDVIAIASELGANAVCHTASGRGGQFSVAVAWTGSVVSIVVGDGGGPTEPRVIDDIESENGRGLRLVRALSLSVEVTGDDRGRFVRADVPWMADLQGPGPENSYGPGNRGGPSNALMTVSLVTPSAGSRRSFDTGHRHGTAGRGSGIT
ncbi:MAG TPA: ATP-binding protein [Streptosporangiaceae bacterium]